MSINTIGGAMLSEAAPWEACATHIGHLLLSTRATDISGVSLGMQEAFHTWHAKTLELRANDGEIYLIGNGASASMASHCAADIMKNGHVRARVFTDMSLLTAVGNDEGYEKAFSLPLERYIRPHDMLVAVSSSGRSPNIMNAVGLAQQKGGHVVTLSAFDDDNPLRSAGDLNFYVPAPCYGWAESCHAAILHYWMDFFTNSARV